MKLNHSKASKKGFSLVEMLVVIAVIGVLTAIAIPMIGRINDQATLAKNNRNAQAVAAMFNAAKSAGIPDTALKDDGSDVKTKIIGKGISFTDPTTNKSLQFVLDMSSKEIDEAVKKLEFTNGSASVKRDKDGNASVTAASTGTGGAN